MTFKEYLTLYRERSGLTIAGLARAIQKTEGYIRKIEKYDYTPPTYAVCCELAELFKLNKSERKSFMRQAYIERTQSESSFLSEFSLTKIASQIAQKRRVEPIVEPDYAFFVGWNTFENQPLINDQTAQDLHLFIVDMIAKAESECIHIQIESNQVRFVIRPPRALDLKSFILGIQSMSAGIVNNHMPNIHTPVWDADYMLNTVGSIAQYEWGESIQVAQQNREQPSPSDT